MERADAGNVLFAHVAARPEEELDLGAAALLIAEVEYPGLDVAHYLSMLDDMADAVRGRAGAASGPDALREAMGHHLFESLGFRGNGEHYYDPRNSFLNEVIDRRVGIPITLSVVVLEVGRRLGLALEGVSFPGHFLVRHRAGEREVLLDPYHGGAALSRADLEERLRAVPGHGDKAELAPAHLAPASKRQILVRMLNNLLGIYRDRQKDAARTRGVLERLAILNPATLKERAGETN